MSGNDDEPRIGNPVITRRELAAIAAGTLATPRLAIGAAWGRKTLSYIETLRRKDGGYAWPDEPDSAMNPTFGAIACYHLLEEKPPHLEQLLAFVRAAPYPWPKTRRIDRPLRGFEYEQARSLAWLGQNAGFLKDAAASWTGPSEFTRRYEFGGNPVFGQEVAALRTRALLGIETREPEWEHYVLERRRDNGTFNNTPASDGSGGHVMNTLWGLLALEILGRKPETPAATVDWLQRCQLDSGGFTYAPDAELGAVPAAVYTWSALCALRMLGAGPADRDACIRFLSSLASGGGFSDKPRISPDPVSTARVIEAFRILYADPPSTSGRRVAAVAVPRTLKAYTIQFEAPGSGSPADAVELAGALRIQLWGAKNAEAGWVERAQEIALQRGVPVTFFPSNEEYGTYVSVPGLGTYSHLSDVFAPPETDFGPSMSDPRNPVPWTQFRDRRIAALKRAGGGILWQFNENEELTRILLDEAVEGRTFDAVSSFHFGNENFLHTQPFLNIYRSQLPFVGLQDNHATEPWWSSAILGGFRTVFLAETPTWQGWTDALRHNRIVTIRRDAVTNFQERLAGGSNQVRHEVLRRRREWDWEGRLPPATVQLVRPGDPFEQPSPETGAAIRIRTRRQHTNMGVLKDVVYELEQLTVDDRSVTTHLVERHNKAGALIDHCHVANLETLRPGSHTATATLRHTTTARQIRKTLHWA